MAMSDSPGTNARRRPIEQIKNWNNVSVRIFLVGNCGGYSSEGFANQEVGTLQLLTARWAAQVEEGGISTGVETTHSLANLRATNGNNEYTLWPHP